MGILGQFHDQRFVDALKQVVGMAQKHGLGGGIQPGSLEQAAAWMEVGFDVICKMEISRSI